MPSKNQSKSKAKPKKEPYTPQRRRAPEDAGVREESVILDSYARRDILGVIFIILAAVFLILAVLPADDAMVSSFASQWMHLVFGIGCYILPIVLLVIGITCISKVDKERLPARVAIGFTIIFIALLGVFSLFAPITTLGYDDPSLLFTEGALVSYGGYIGSAIDWCGISLFGRIITAIILIGIMIIGAIVIGFSISKLLDAAKARKRLDGTSANRFASRTLGSGGFARVRRAEGGHAATPEELEYLRQMAERDDFDPAVTGVIRPGYDVPAVQTDHGNDGYDQDGGFVDFNQNEEMQPGATRRLNTVDDFMDIDGATRRLGESSSTRRLPVISADDQNGAMRPLNRAGAHARMDEEVTDESDLIEDLPEANASSKQTEKRSRSKSSKKKEEAVEEGAFALPPMSLLNQQTSTKSNMTKSDLEQMARNLEEVLSDFGINAQVVDWIAGPTVTLFELERPAGVRVSRFTALSDDIALALASPGVRIFAPVPHTNYVGIEVPNTVRNTVYLSEVLEEAPEGALQIAIGKDVEGNSIVSDLSKMPHLLIGGTTGSGKSVSINAMIMSILMRATPDEVRFIMVDPKRVEFTPYNGIPHLYIPVVTEPSEAANALAWGVAEMERRLKVMSKEGVRNITQYNAKMRQLAEEAKFAANEAQDAETDDEAAPTDAQSTEDEFKEMPYIVIIIDELADLMMNVGKEVELSISRIAQLARAAGIHLIVATQRPSTNVVTGLIKANITNRIAFNVASGIDSRVVLDSPGAENLIGNGDMLLSKPELAKPQRIQGCFVTEEEINNVVDFVKAQGTPEYHDEILKTNVISIGNTNPGSPGAGSSRDPLIWEAADMIVSSGIGSTSNIQRRLKVGYARAGRIMDQLEELGIVGAANGSKPREVLVDPMELETIRAFEESEDPGSEDAF